MWETHLQMIKWRYFFKRWEWCNIKSLPLSSNLSVFTLLLYLNNFPIFCRTHPSGHWTTLRSLPGLSLGCRMWLSTLTETCWWWRTWTMPAHPLCCSRGCQLFSVTYFSSVVSESESTGLDHNIVFAASCWLALSSSRCCRCVQEHKTSRDVMSNPSFILAVLLLWNFGLLIVDRILHFLINIQTWLCPREKFFYSWLTKCLWVEDKT